MTNTILRRGARAAAIGLVVLLAGLIFAGYGAYRVDAFTQATFRPDTVLPVGQAPDTGGGVPAGEVATSSDTLGYGDSAPIAQLHAGRPFTILLLGFGGAGHDGAYLTDSLEVARLDPTSGAITLISVPRDLWVHIPRMTNGQGDYWGKINEAYALGVGTTDPGTGGDNRRHQAGGALASTVVAQVLGIPIDAWLSLDFVGFRQFIDALGGVDVDVAQTFTDDHYPNNDDADIDPSYKTIHFDAGPQHLDGEAALAFARSRYAPEDGSDFGRARRQQRVLSGVARQLASPGALPRAFALLDALTGHVHTSLSSGEARDLAGWAQERATTGQRPTFRTGVLDTATTGLLTADASAAGQDILLPAAGRGNFTAIRAYVRTLIADSAPSAP